MADPDSCSASKEPVEVVSRVGAEDAEISIHEKQNTKPSRSKVDSGDMSGILAYSNRLLRAAVEFAKEQGAKIVEGCLCQQQVRRNIFVYACFASIFCKVGFAEVPSILKLAQSGGKRSMNSGCSDGYLASHMPIFDLPSYRKAFKERSRGLAFRASLCVIFTNVN
jgi:hypothetical protein